MVIDSGHVQVAYFVDSFCTDGTHVPAQIYKRPHADEKKQDKASNQKLGGACLFAALDIHVYLFLLLLLFSDKQR